MVEFNTGAHGVGNLVPVWRERIYNYPQAGWPEMLLAWLDQGQMPVSATPMMTCADFAL